MFKQIFENKKAAVFDLETIAFGLDNLYIQTFSEVLTDLGVDWIYIPKLVKKGDKILDIWERVLKDPYITSITDKIPLEQLLNTTNTKFINLLYKTNIDVREGFWEFIDELKNTFKFKVILKSEINRVLTKELILNLEIDDIFDLVIVQGEEKKKNLYFEILKVLKKHGISNKETLAFEFSKKGAKQATSKEILTIAIGEDLAQDSYPTRVTIFEKDFSGFPGNMDKTYLETLREAHNIG